MAAALTSAPSPNDQQPTDGQLKRRRLVERLRKEGRAYGQAPMGFRVVGKRGSRRLVPDDHQRRRMRLVAEWRDRDGMSWDQVSDALEEYVAGVEDRKPLSRGFRRGTTKKTAWRMYRAYKRLEQGEPLATHRRCRNCGGSLPIDQFTATGRVCLVCRITRPLKEFEERVMGLTSASLIGTIRNGGRPRPASRQETVHRLQGAFQNVLNLARRKPNSAELHEAIEALTTALERDLAANVPAEAMSESQLQEELRSQLRRELRPVVLAAQAEFAMSESSGHMNEVEV